MYKLTLTKDEREAIDWVGHRYLTGTAFSDLLLHQDTLTVEDREWDHRGDVTFLIPEHVAHEINELFEQEDFLFPCFAQPFASKLLEWSNSIV